MTYETLRRGYEAIKQQPEPQIKYVVMGIHSYNRLEYLAKYHKAGDKIVSRIGRTKKYRVKYIVEPLHLTEKGIHYRGVTLIKDEYL